MYPEKQVKTENQDKLARKWFWQKADVRG